MNQQNRERLHTLLRNLCVLQDNASRAGEENPHLAEMFERRDLAKEAIIRFVDSLIVGELDATDPRSSLRSCKTNKHDLAYYFHLMVCTHRAWRKAQPPHGNSQRPPSRTPRVKK